MGFLTKLLNKRPVTLVDGNKKYALPLIEKEELTHDTRCFRFGLPSPKHVLGISICQHVSLSAIIGDEPVVRVYTPITTNNETGYVEVVVKVYFKTEEFPNGGKLSLYMENMKIGDTIDFRGPVGKHQYIGNGKFHIKSKKTGPTTKLQGKRLNMIAGGSGLTPMFQLIKHICQDSKDSTQIRLLFANKTDDDIMLRKELDILASKYPSQFQIWYTVGKPLSQDWTYSIGRINEEMIRSHLFPAGNDVIVLMCGPDPMIDLTCKPALEEIGFKPNQMIVF